MNLFFVRHGETDANKNGIIQGWLDTTLNETGKQQAAEVAQSFSHPIDAIYSSDLKRTIETAQAFRDLHPDVPYFQDARIRECDFGDATGTLREENDWEEFWSSTDHSTIPHAETLSDFTARVKAFIDDLRTTPYTSVVIVTHGGVLNRVEALFYPDYAHRSHPNTGILEVTIETPKP